jgi:hypothetical protein
MVSNARITVNDEFGRMLEETVEACFTAVSWNLLEAPEDKPAQHISEHAQNMKTC